MGSGRDAACKVFVGDDGETYVLGSDRDSGLRIFRDTALSP